MLGMSRLPRSKNTNPNRRPWTNGPEWHTKSPTYSASFHTHPSLLRRLQPLLVDSGSYDPLSCTTFCTTLYLASGHSFNTDCPLLQKKYFYPLNVFCGCGYEVRAIPYIIYDCILFLEVRNSVGIDNRRVTTLPTLLGAVNRAKSLLRFLDNGP